MAGKKKKKKYGNSVAQNRRARFDYNIVETVEAGIMLTGTEVKSLRLGRASINESFAGEKKNELYLQNAHIPEYTSGIFNHEPRRPRKLLLHARELDKMIDAVQRKGMSLIPLSIYFNDRGLAKVQLALGEGKRKQDKRESVKKQDWDRQKSRLMREQG